MIEAPEKITSSVLSFYFIFLFFGWEEVENFEIERIDEQNLFSNQNV